MPLPVHGDPKIAVPELTAYLRGELPDEARRAFEAHLPGCERCRKAIAVAGTLFAGVTQPPAAPSAAPTAAELVARMDAELAQVRARNARLQLARRRNVLWGLAVLTLLLSLSAVGLVMVERRTGAAGRASAGARP